MRISDLTGRKVGLLGFGREGRATHDALRATGHRATVHAFADRPIPVPEGVLLHVGTAGVAAFPELDVVVRSPGFAPHHPLRVALDAAPVAQTTATALFLAEARWARWPVVGITGSKGKSTTSTLAHLALQQAGVASALVGNVGVAAIELLDRFRSEALVAVFELSSYQCADLEDGAGPNVACLLDLFPEHMDWHGGVGGYYAAKARIGLSQTASDAFRYSARAWPHLPESIRERLGARGPALVQPLHAPEGLHFEGGWFRRGGARLWADEAMALPGVHNRENAVAAFAATEGLGVAPAHMQQVLASFRGLPFRLEDEGVHAGVRWINDSLSTAPEVSAVALRAMGPSVSTLIVGGHDRGYDPAALVQALSESPVRTLITLPDTGPAVARAARDARLSLSIREAANLDEAVAISAASSPRGTTCLFSPGAPSYNAYDSFEERGRHFRRLVRGLGDAGD